MESSPLLLKQSRIAHSPRLPLQDRLQYPTSSKRQYLAFGSLDNSSPVTFSTPRFDTTDLSSSFEDSSFDLSLPSSDLDTPDNSLSAHAVEVARAGLHPSPLEMNAIVRATAFRNLDTPVKSAFPPIHGVQRRPRGSPTTTPARYPTDGESPLCSLLSRISPAPPSTPFQKRKLARRRQGSVARKTTAVHPRSRREKENVPPSELFKNPRIRSAPRMLSETC
jgi:hypothetical protein